MQGTMGKLHHQKAHLLHTAARIHKAVCFCVATSTTCPKRSASLMTFVFHVLRYTFRKMRILERDPFEFNLPNQIFFLLQNDYNFFQRKMERMETGVPAKHQSSERN